MVLIAGGINKNNCNNTTNNNQINNGFCTTGALFFGPLDDLGLIAFAVADGTDGDKLRDGGKVDDDILTDTDYTDTDTLRENKLTRSDCFITLTNSMTEIKSVTIARNLLCRKFTHTQSINLVHSKSGCVIVS